MGTLPLPVYGEDIGSAVEDVEKVLNKIKSNKFKNEDLIKLYNANAELLRAVLNDKYKN